MCGQTACVCVCVSLEMRVREKEKEREREEERERERESFGGCVALLCRPDVTVIKYCLTCNLLSGSIHPSSIDAHPCIHVGVSTSPTATAAVHCCLTECGEGVGGVCGETDPQLQSPMHRCCCLYCTQKNKEEKKEARRLMHAIDNESNELVK